MGMWTSTGASLEWQHMRPKSYTANDTLDKVFDSVDAAVSIVDVCENISMEDPLAKKRFLYKVGGVNFMLIVRKLERYAIARCQKIDFSPDAHGAQPPFLAEVADALTDLTGAVAKLSEEQRPKWYNILASEESYIATVSKSILSNVWEYEAKLVAKVGAQVAELLPKITEAINAEDVVDGKELLALAKSDNAKIVQCAWPSIRAARSISDESYNFILGLMPAGAAADVDEHWQSMSNGRDDGDAKNITTVIAAFLIAQAVFKQRKDPEQAVSVASSFIDDNSAIVHPKLGLVLSAKRMEFGMNV